MSNLFYFKPKLGFPEWETQEAVEWLLKNEGKKCWGNLGRETGVRTLPQNASMHVLFEQLANDLNDRGLSVQKVLSHSMEIDWNEKRVKELLWRPTQIELTGKKSTTTLDKTSEIDEIYETLNRFVAQFGVHIPFPSQATKNEKATYNN